MKLPRDVSGDDLAEALRAFGYQVTRQTGSHSRLTTAEGGEHHVSFRGTVPCLWGTLAGILDEAAAHFSIGRDELLGRIRL